MCEYFLNYSPPLIILLIIYSVIIVSKGMTHVTFTLIGQSENGESEVDC